MVERTLAWLVADNHRRGEVPGSGEKSTRTLIAHRRHQPQAIGQSRARSRRRMDPRDVGDQRTTDEAGSSPATKPEPLSLPPSPVWNSWKDYPELGECRLFNSLLAGYKQRLLTALQNV